MLLELLASPADNVCKQLDPDQTEQNVKPDLDPNCLTLEKTSAEDKKA